jgi:hypothetical protein
LKTNEKRKAAAGSPSRSKHLLALVDALDNYIRLLCNELTDCVTIAHVHGWRSTRCAQGEKMRREIATLRRKANEQVRRDSAAPERTP